MKKFKSILVLAAVLLFAGASTMNAQVTIGSNTPPAATLDVVASAPSDADVAEGVIAPRLTLAQLDAKVAAYTAAHAGVIVYVSSVAGGSTETATAAITVPGYYYFNGTAWQAMASNPRATLADLQSPTYLTQEGDIVYVTNVTGDPEDATSTVNITRPGYYYYNSTTGEWETLGGGSTDTASKVYKITDNTFKNFTAAEVMPSAILYVTAGSARVQFPTAGVAVGTMVTIITHPSGVITLCYDDDRNNTISNDSQYLLHYDPMGYQSGALTANGNTQVYVYVGDNKWAVISQL